MNEYSFADLAELAGASTSELKHWVQRGLIRPDVRETTGTGAHRTFGFLDVFEACVARTLNQLPGGMPIHYLSYALDGLRFDTAYPFMRETTAWREFLDPATRTKTSGFWLYVNRQDLPPRVVNRAARDVVLRETADAVAFLRLDTLLLDLERRTHDHSTAEERDQAWMKCDPSIVDVAEDPRELPRANTPASRRAIAAKAKE